LRKDSYVFTPVPSSRLRKLAEGEYVGRTEPVIFLVHQNRGPFLWAVQCNPAQRREVLQQGWNDVGKVFLIATILDVVYQLIVLRGVHILELLITAATLARRKTFSETTRDPIGSVTLGLVTVFDFLA
jgi:hypothetical protein